jgi:ribonuclease HII
MVGEGMSGGRCKRGSDPVRFDRALLAGVCEEGRDLRLAGVDEAGRGCLAGPLVAASVVFDYSCLSTDPLEGLTDSKLLSSAAREAVYPRILAAAAGVAWVTFSPDTIDEVGLHRCNLAALGRSLELLDGGYALAVVDGFELSRADLRARTVIRADYKSAVTAAASVVAKVVRDRLMRRLDERHPGYGFATHVGYGTRAHKEALRVLGPCSLHRRSFRGVDTAQQTLWEE